MRVVIQRVSKASVEISGRERESIGTGLVVLVGMHPEDMEEDVDWMSGKVVRLRIFPDDDGLMNRSLDVAGGQVLVISQFTLFASTKKGNRPSFVNSAKPETAVPIYEKFLEKLRGTLGDRVKSGEFGANMKVSLVNDGPVTIIVDSKRRE
ncbi:MAG: D-tyrosyl-tRNA(Tyr) deacylase [Verrucomicrobia bacterium]|nr:D-tyrosyl-tRNA(Tyr) deacylase [Verrucomicrobiota bacterium]